MGNESRVNFKRGMEVFTGNGEKLGVVEAINGNSFEVAGKLISATMISGIEDNRLYVAGTLAQYQHAHNDAPIDSLTYTNQELQPQDY